MTNYQTPSSVVACCAPLGDATRNKPGNDATDRATTDATKLLKSLAKRVLSRGARNNDATTDTTTPQKVVARQNEHATTEQPKEAQVSELETPHTPAVEISTAAPSDPDCIAEFSTFTDQERQAFFNCRAVGLEEGADLHRAERDAAAAILQHRRLSKPLPFWVVKALQREQRERNPQ